MEQYYFFIVMSILLIILPGPDTGLATKNTIAYGKKGGLKTVLGITSGLFIHTFAAVLGLSAIIVKSAFLFSAFKYIGAIYLIYLGFISLWSLRKKEVTIEGDEQKQSKYQGASCFRQGFLTNLLNPKVAVFFLTFLPQFVVPESNAFLQLFAMGVIYTGLTFVWFVLYVSLIDYISAWMKKPSAQHVIQGITGFVLVGFGIKLALEKNP
jgi:RhtB (resistance to homoserine/threonine) family protein